MHKVGGFLVESYLEIHNLCAVRCHQIMTVAVGVAIVSALPCLMFTKEISIDGLIPERSLVQVLK